ncbi:flagellar hook capping FlgD N-terminal domain-containing protein [Aeromonas schubertii]|uniref:Basal-body rod modification protein FlgD n=1 Tax=Aeromonas schubertii TaxID=652 RepID=A0A0S2SGL4_9GAMM|nr:flagellar hook capping FlgD N-terminal domain-containing protein [Aeromonas schubertii]ALP40828.1 flagellar hook capping protein [Aeromonas schubertii]
MSLSPLSSLDTARGSAFQQVDPKVASNPATSQSSSQGATQSSAQNGGMTLRNEFLQMMVAQIQNQDPTNPLDGTQYVTQLAQFSMVEGVEQLKVLQQQSIAMMDTQQVLAATNLVGQEVMVPAEGIALASEQGVRGQIELPGAADQVTLTVYDEFGQKVQSREWGARKGGVIDYQLDALPPGKYSVKVEAKGPALSSQPKNYLASSVERVNLPGDGQIMLQVTGIGDVPLFSAVQFGQA